MMRNTMTNRNPWREFGVLQQEMNRLFNDFGAGSRRVFPALNMQADSEQAVLTAELPGLKQSDITLSLMNNALTIEGTRSIEPLQEGEAYHRRERSVGQFKRTVDMPFLVDAEKISADLKNGILTVRLPRKEEDKPKSISVQG